MDPCLTPRHRRGGNGNRRPGAARHEMHTRRLGRLSGTTAERLLDGGDGPSPLPELLAAATAPATAAELRGESAARAAFRSSTRPAPLPDDLRRRSTVRVTTSIMIAKAIAAIALTAGTAGSIALATTATPADLPARTTSESAAADDAASSSPVLAAPTPTGAALADPDGADDAAAGDEPGRSGSAGTAARTTPEAKASHSTGLCRASSNITTIDHPGKAAGSPAFAGLDCDDADARADDSRRRGHAARRAAPPLRPANPRSGPASPTTPAARRTTTDTEDTAESPARRSITGAPRRQRASAASRRSIARTADPLQTRRAVRRRYSQSRTVPPVPWSYRAASAARSWSSAATRSGSPAMLRYAAIVGP